MTHLPYCYLLHTSLECAYAQQQKILTPRLMTKNWTHIKHYVFEQSMKFGLYTLANVALCTKRHAVCLPNKFHQIQRKAKTKMRGRNTLSTSSLTCSWPKCIQATWLMAMKLSTSHPVKSYMFNTMKYNSNARTLNFGWLANMDREAKFNCRKI